MIFQLAVTVSFFIAGVIIMLQTMRIAAINKEINELKNQVYLLELHQKLTTEDIRDSNKTVRDMKTKLDTHNKILHNINAALNLLVGGIK